MASVINKTTNQYLASVNTPDYSESDWVINPDLSSVSGIASKYWKVVDGQVVEMSSGEKAVVDGAISQAYIETVITAAIKFGTSLMTKYAAENVLLGITQAGMTRTISGRISGILAALQTGSLYDAIAEAKAIPAENKDATFITNARLLVFINRVESYLGITLSTEV